MRSARNGNAADVVGARSPHKSQCGSTRDNHNDFLSTATIQTENNVSHRLSDSQLEEAGEK